MTVTALRSADRTSAPSVRDLILNGPPPNPTLVRNPLTDERRAAMSIIQVATPDGVIETPYSSPLGDIDSRLPDPERVRVGWREGQRNIYNRRTEDPGWFDDIGSLWGLLKRA